MSRAIVHLDADAFFAAVEQAGDPKLRGKPMAGGGERRGIIASAPYEARKFGVYTPMPTVRPRKLCPKLIVLPGDFERYEQFSSWMFGYYPESWIMPSPAANLVKSERFRVLECSFSAL